jgi:hypothetical protein
MTSHRNISLSPDAVEAFEQFRLFQHHTKEELDGREREWWAKAPAHVLRLAGTLSIMSWAMVGGSLPDRIELEFVEAAREGTNFEGLPVWRIFPRPIIGDFGTKQMDLDNSSLLHPGGSNAA